MKQSTIAACIAFLVMPVATLAAGGVSDADLIEAVKRQDRAAVEHLLQQGTDVNARQGDGATSLHWAVHLNDLETAALLIRSGGHVDAANGLGVTPLLVACANGSAAAVGLLLEAGADPNLGPPGRETPLMAAAWTGSVDAVIALLDHGAAVNAREASRQQTALMWAASQKHPGVVRALVERGADIHARTVSRGVEGRRTRADAGYTPLVFAARNGDVESTRILLDAGANVNDTVDDGMSALTLATVRGHVPVALFLLVRGADPNANGAGYSPLHWAAGSWETQFTTTDITTDREGEDEWNSLIGLKGAKLQMVQALLAHGADPNARMKTAPARAGATRSPTLPELAGATPFLLAAMAGDTAVMRALKDGGADPSLTTDQHSTALMAAAGLGRILGENTVPETDLLDAATLAMEFGAAVAAVDDFGNTALHYAAYHRLSTVVQFLADQGAALDAKNMFEETPLWVSELVIQWFGGGTFKIVPTSTGDLLRSLGAHAPRPPYEKRPGDWPNNDLR